MNSLKKGLLLLIFFAISLHSFSQTEDDTIPLIIILKNIEKRYDVRFSYADKTIKNINLKKPDFSFTLEEALKYLQTKTGLTFNKLNERFISVENKKKTKTSKNTFKLQRLDEITIQNYLTKGLAKTTNGTLEITPQDFGILPGLIEPDLLQTIQALPGIVSADELISNLSIRGGTNDQNLILYEGIRMYQTGHFFGLISAFNPYLSKSVNIATNGTKVKYGSGVSSIISIENSDVIDDNFKAGAGSNLISTDAFAKIPLSKKTELQVSARRSFTDLLLSPTYDSYFERIFKDSELNMNTTAEATQNENFFFYDINAKFLYNINEDSKLRINLINIFNRLDYDQQFTNSSNQPESTESNLEQISFAASVSYQKKWSSSTDVTAQLYLSNYTINGISKNTITNQQLKQENKVEDLGVRLDVLKTLDKNLNLNTGYQYNEVGVTNLEDVTNPRFRSLVKEVVRTHAIYGEAEFTSNSKNTYGRIGLRGNYIEKFDEFIFEPRMAFNQKFLDYFRLELLGEIKSQSITQIIDLQQDFFGIEKRRWQLSDNDIVPIIKSNQFSVGLNYNRKGWLINAEAYTKNVLDITTRSQGFQNQYQLVNAIGSYNIKGIDLLVNKQFSKFSSWLGYSYSKNDYEFEDLNEGNPFSNNIDLRHVGDFSLSYAHNNLKIAAGVNWHSGKPFTNPNTIQNNNNTTIEYDTPNAERLPDYIRTDVSAIYKFRVSETVNGEVGASIWNLLNKDNSINRFYTLDRNNEVVENNNQSLGFTPNFSFRLNF